MRRITLIITSTLAAVILLLSYRTSTRSTNAIAAPAAPPGIVTGAAPTPATVSRTGKPGRRTTKPTPTKPASITVNGPTEQTSYGPVQVQVTIFGKRISSVQTLQHPSGDDRSIQIADDALPQLRSKTLAAQSAQINSVSGATYTSAGYQRSLQGALDLAHFG
ncbi:MAG: hypothetical protein QOH97_4515 [Actinoplanes sp.]|jgi:uncharacterized protein with FMN-binding domain|nr:hypothetical protein [Actinoplanes sp.]